MTLLIRVAGVQQSFQKCPSLRIRLTSTLTSAIKPTTFLLTAPLRLSSIIISHTFTQHAELKAWLLWSYSAYL